jgi:hypothetical protein
VDELSVGGGCQRNVVWGEGRWEGEGKGGLTWYCAAVLQLAMRAGSAMRFLRPWAPKAPSMMLEAPKRVPTVQKGGMVRLLNWDWVAVEWGAVWRVLV